MHPAFGGTSALPIVTARWTDLGSAFADAARDIDQSQP